MAGMPSITINYRQRAATVNTRAGQEILAAIILDADTESQGINILTNAADIPAAWAEANRLYIARAFSGYVNRPRKIIVYVLPTDAVSYAAALTALSTYDFDWLVGDPGCSATLASEIDVWIKAQRTNYDKPYKAVLPDSASDHEAIVNFTTDGIAAGATEYTTAAYCSRIAGILAATPLSMSATYAPLTELSDVEHLTKVEMDTAVNAGKFILFHDGVKVKVGRAVTSLITLGTKSSQLKKIKMIDALDVIRRDLRQLCEDSYIGQMANSYDNKCVLITAIRNYFDQLEAEGVVQAGKTTVGIDVAAQRAYLVTQGVDVSQLTDQQIKEYDTDDQVFVAVSMYLLDAIEDITINVTF